MRAPAEIEVLRSLREVSSIDWDGGVDPNDPFTEHAFLALLEESGCLGAQAGWLPMHLLVRENGEVVGRSPLYLKNNSYGEYIFDWGWADGAHHAGIPYYPKLVSAVPFTPATSRRFLTDRHEVRLVLVEGMLKLMETTRAHSLHLLFTTAEERTGLEDHAALIGRSTHQFHWDNEGYEDFSAWLGTLRSKYRKMVKRERRAPTDTGTQIHMWRGDELTPSRWQTMHALYQDTIRRKHAQPYLTPAFFELAPSRVAHSAVIFAATVGEEVVAASLCFQRGSHLYGRYWGCRPGFRALHFELCYHAPIAACIAEGWTHFEAGAQGMHKLKRGLMPAETHSLHHLREPRLHQAVAEAVREENKRTAEEMEHLTTFGPFRASQEAPS